MCFVFVCFDIFMPMTITTRAMIEYVDGDDHCQYPTSKYSARAKPVYCNLRKDFVHWGAKVHNKRPCQFSFMTDDHGFFPQTPTRKDVVFLCWTPHWTSSPTLPPPPPNNKRLQKYMQTVVTCRWNKKDVSSMSQHNNIKKNAKNPFYPASCLVAEQFCLQYTNGMVTLCIIW